MPGELHFQGTHWCLKQDAEQAPAAHSCLSHTRQGQVAAFVCCTVLGLLPLQLTAAGRHALYAKSPILIRRDTARRWRRAICGKKDHLQDASVWVALVACAFLQILTHM